MVGSIETTDWIKGYTGKIRQKSQEKHTCSCHGTTQQCHTFIHEEAQNLIQSSISMALTLLKRTLRHNLSD